MDEAAGELPHVRLRGLDVMRGLVLGWLIVLVYTPTTGWRGHAEWFGWDNSDLFFPMFLFVAGAGLAMQTRRRIPWARLVKRFISLTLLGLLVNAWLGDGADLSHLRYPGVLQRIVVVGLAGLLLVWATRRRWWAALALSVALAFGWGAMLHAASVHCPDGRPSREGRGCGTFVEVDRALFGDAHIYRQGQAGHDPEGTASTLGALATFLAGFGAAQLVHEQRGRRLGERAGLLVAMAAGWLALTPVFLWFVPVAKRLWTPAFVSLNAAGGLAALALLMVVFDAGYRRAWGERIAASAAWPLVAVGRNALVIWMGVFLLEGVFHHSVVAGQPMGDWLLAAHGAGGYLLVALGWFAIAWAMHAADWHVRL